MKLKTVFKLSALSIAVAFSNTMVNAAVLNENVDITGNVDVEGKVDIKGNVTVDGKTDFKKDVNIDANLNVKGEAITEKDITPTKSGSTLSTSSLGSPNTSQPISYTDTYTKGVQQSSSSQLYTKEKLEFSSKQEEVNQKRVVNKTADAQYDANGEFSGISNVQTLNPDNKFVADGPTKLISEDSVILGKEDSTKDNALTIRKTETVKVSDSETKLTSSETKLTASGVTTTGTVSANKITLEGEDLATSLKGLKDEDVLIREEFAAADTKVREDFAAADKALSERVTTNEEAIKGYDKQIKSLNDRATDLNTRINDVEKTANRGVAISLAAQQQVPNIGAGQTAFYGGVGHYESESAFALGLTTVFGNGRTSLSGAVGVAGGSEVGGRVGIAHVFGGK
jgi:trimeric autotransporter adhesin